MKPSERIEQLERNVYARGMRPTPVDELAVRAAVTCQAIADFLDEQHEGAGLAERKRIQRAMPETFGSMGRDERATQKLRSLHDELRSWKLDYEQRISNLDPAANTRDFEITYKAFVVGIERLMEIIEQ